MEDYTLPTPPTFIRTSKEQASSFSVGERASITVSGEIEAIRKINEGNYEITLAQSVIENKNSSGKLSSIADKIRSEKKGTKFVSHEDIGSPVC